MEQTLEPPPARVSAGHLLMLAGVVLLVLWPLTTFEFVRWDDPENLSANPDMTPPTLGSVAEYWDPRQPHDGLYIPFTYTVWAGLASFAHISVEEASALNPRVFHAANLILHALSAMVVFVILLRLIGRTWAAWVGAALFAVHPVQVEPVAWVSGLKDVLSGLLSLVAVWLYVEHARRPPGRAARMLFAGATLAFVLAMLSKPSAMVVPLIVAAIDLGLLRRPVRRVAVLIAPWLVMAAAVAIVAWNAQPAPAAEFVRAWWARPIVALDALAFYIKQVVFPIKLGIDYGRSPAWLSDSDERYYTWAVPIAALIVAVALRNRARAVVVAAGIFVLGVLPVLGFVPFAFQAHSTVADRYLYLAMLGPALFVAWAVAHARGRLVVPLALACIATFGVRSFMQTWAWRDSRELFGHALRVNRYSVLANTGLADVLREEIVDGLRRGDRYGTDLKFQAALSYYWLALDARRDDPQALLGLADLIAISDKPGDAVPIYLKVMRIRGPSAELHAKLGHAYLLRHDPEQALHHLSEALRLDPGNREARSELREMQEELSIDPALSAPLGP